MKKLTTIALACLLMLTVLASCNNGSTPEQTTPEQTTEAPTEAPTVPEVTEPESTEALTTEESTTAAPEESTLNELGLPFEIFDIPVGYANGQPLRGYNASGNFYYDDELKCMWSDSDNNMLVVTNDTMDAGMLSATFLCAPGHINDNGIIFGLEDSQEGEYEFWEFGPAYYFLFISDIQHLYLAKAGFNGEPWTELEVTEYPVPEYTHGETEITISVEFDGNGHIQCYANDQLLIDYYDSDPIKGNRYGIRCEVFGVEYYNVMAAHE